MTGPPLRLTGVAHAYPGEHEATVVLDHIDLALEPFELAALVGPSGAGKSTLLNISGALTSPTNGDVAIAGTLTRDLDRAGLARLRANHVGFVFQDPNLLASLTIAENVAVPALLAGVSRRAAATRALELLDRVDLGDHAHRRPAQLSGGQRQRAAIARALVNTPTLVLADEPTGQLDTTTGRTIAGLLRDTADTGTAVLLVTHDLRLAAGADRIHHLRDGRLTHTTQQTYRRADLGDLLSVDPGPR